MGKLILHKVSARKNDINDITNCEVYLVQDVKLKGGDGIRDGVEIVFHNSKTGHDIDLLIDEDGKLLLSEEY